MSTKFWLGFALGIVVNIPLIFAAYFKGTAYAWETVERLYRLRKQQAEREIKAAS